MDKISRAALMTSALAVGTAAGAVPVTMSQRINLGSALNASQTLAGTFDIRSLLVDAQGHPVQIDLSSARLTAFAYSDAQMSYSQSSTGYYNTGAGYYFTYYTQQQGVYYYTYSYSCGSWWSSRTCYAQAAHYYYYYAPAQGYVADLRNDVTNYATDTIVDRAQLSVNAQSIEDSVATANSYAQTGNSYLGSNQYSQGYIEQYSQRTFQSNSIASGELDLLMDLGEANLLDLEADGLLDFAMGMLVGRASFNWIQLDLVGEQSVYAEPEEPSEVPEPGSLALLGLGLISLGVGRRARDRRNKAA